jgi:hypothetical protein
MKINLYGREAELVQSLQAVGGYETFTAVVRKLVNDYYPDLHDRLSRTGTATVPRSSPSAPSIVPQTVSHCPPTDHKNNPPKNEPPDFS